MGGAPKGAAVLDRPPAGAAERSWQVAVGQGPLPWYVQNKSPSAAPSATFLGLTISRGGRGRRPLAGGGR